jgi:hypothetical protein
MLMARYRLKILRKYVGWQLRGIRNLLLDSLCLQEDLVREQTGLLAEGEHLLLLDIPLLCQEICAARDRSLILAGLIASFGLNNAILACCSDGEKQLPLGERKFGLIDIMASEDKPQAALRYMDPRLILHSRRFGVGTGSRLRKERGINGLFEELLDRQSLYLVQRKSTSSRPLVADNDIVAGNQRIPDSHLEVPIDSRSLPRRRLRFWQ